MWKQHNVTESRASVNVHIKFQNGEDAVSEDHIRFYFHQPRTGIYGLVSTVAYQLNTQTSLSGTNKHVTEISSPSF